MYHALNILSSALFSCSSLCRKAYAGHCSSILKATLPFMLYSTVFGSFFFFIIGGLDLPANMVISFVGGLIFRNSLPFHADCHGKGAENKSTQHHGACFGNSSNNSNLAIIPL